MKIIQSHQCITTRNISEINWNNVPEFQPTSTLDEPLHFICRSGSPAMHLFEFGTWVGRSALGFSQNYEQVVTMDYIQNSDIAYSYNFKNIQCSPGELVKNTSNVKVILHDSLTYDFSNFKNLFDIVYVDGNHSEEGCTSDLKNAMLISKPKSVIFVDDYSNTGMGVYRAVDKFEHPLKYYIADLNLVMLINK